MQDSKGEREFLIKHEREDEKTEKRGERAEKEKESKNWGCFPFLFVIRMQASGGNPSNFCKGRYNDPVTSSKQTRISFTAGPSCAAREPEIYSKAEQSRQTNMANTRHQISITKRVCPNFCGFPPNQQHSSSEMMAGVEGRRGKALPSHTVFEAPTGPKPDGQSQILRRQSRTPGGRSRTLSGRPQTPAGRFRTPSGLF